MCRRELWSLVRIWRWGRVCSMAGWGVGRVWRWGRISSRFSCRFSGGGGFGLRCGCGSVYRLCLVVSLALVVVMVVVMFAMLAVFAVRQIGEFLGCVHLIYMMLGVLAILEAQMVWVDHHLVLP